MSGLREKRNRQNRNVGIGDLDEWRIIEAYIERAG